MKTDLIGATSLVGSKLLSESLDRGHQVTAVIRNPERLPTHPQLKAAKGDVANLATAASLVADHDVVMRAFNPGMDASGAGARSIIDAVRRSGVKRLVVMGAQAVLRSRPASAWSINPTFPRNRRAARSALRLSWTNCTVKPIWIAPS